MGDTRLDEQPQVGAVSGKPGKARRIKIPVLPDTVPVPVDPRPIVERLKSFDGPAWLAVFRQNLPAFSAENRAVWTLRRQLGERGKAFVLAHGDKLRSERRHILDKPTQACLEVLLYLSGQGDHQAVLDLLLLARKEPLAFPAGAHDGMWREVFTPSITAAADGLSALLPRS